MAPLRRTASKRLRKQEYQKWFVSKVRDCRLLYDSSDPNYKNIRMKEITWSKIGEACGLTGPAAYSKWKALRDRYIRERKLYVINKERANGEYPEFKPKWPLYKCVGMVVESITDASQCANNTSSEEQLLDLTLPEENSVKSEVESDDQESNLDEASWSSVSNSRAEGNVPVVHSVHNLNWIKRSETVSRQPMDQVEYYLASLIPRLRQLPPLELSRLRLQFEQYVYDAEMRVMGKNNSNC